MSEHVLVAEHTGQVLRYERGPRGGTALELGDYSLSIRCNGCSGWQECDGDHTGFDPEDEDSPAFDRYEDVEIHGESHEWKWGHSWTVPYVGCVLAGNDGWQDSAYEILRTYGPGEYAIDEDWDDTDVYIMAVSMADGSPLPEEGWADRVAVDELED